MTPYANLTNLTHVFLTCSGKPAQNQGSSPAVVSLFFFRLYAMSQVSFVLFKCIAVVRNRYSNGSF